MKPLDKDLSIITHVLSYCEQIDETMERFGRSQDIFMSDKIYRNAVALCILQIHWQIAVYYYRCLPFKRTGKVVSASSSTRVRESQP